jgi:hypothetical protein
MLGLVQKGFEVPEKLDCPKFVIRKLCTSDVYLDYLAVMSSIDIIQKTRGGKWPTPALTFEDDLIDLAWHQREFEFKSTFAYTVMNKEGTECLGCLYFFRPGMRKNPPVDADVDVSFWVTQKGYDAGLYFELYSVIKDWLNSWPFKRPYWSNSELP